MQRSLEQMQSYSQVRPEFLHQVLEDLRPIRATIDKAIELLPRSGPASVRTVHEDLISLQHQLHTHLSEDSLSAAFMEHPTPNLAQLRMYIRVTSKAIADHVGRVLCLDSIP